MKNKLILAAITCLVMCGCSTIERKVESFDAKMEKFFSERNQSETLTQKIEN